MHLTFVEQAEQLGTGHAVSRGVARRSSTSIGDTDGDVLILPGDTPLLRAEHRARACSAQHRERQAALTVLTAVVEDPSGYGRIVRGQGRLGRAHRRRARRHGRRARSSSEVNTSIMVVRASLLGPALRRVGRQNAQNEYYLTDLVAVLHDAGPRRRQSLVARRPAEAAGVNDRAQLAAAEAVLRRRINERWMQRGRDMWDPAHTYVDADVELGRRGLAAAGHRASRAAASSSAARTNRSPRRA